MSWSTIVGARVDTLCREIASGAYERLGTYALTYPIVDGYNIQSYQFYYWRQRTIEDSIDMTQPRLTSGWVNHNAGPLNVGETDFLFFDRSSFASVAGLNDPDLWRRKVNMGDAFSYGKMQIGDIIGSWIFEDLQAALTAMKWVRNRTYYEYYGNCQKLASGVSQAAANADFASADWQFGSGYEMKAYSDDSGATKLLRRFELPLYTPYSIFSRVSSGTCAAYFKGDAVKSGTVFNSFGDTGVVEGVGTTQMRAARESTYPDDLLDVDSAPASVLPATQGTAPSWASGIRTGYSIPTLAGGPGGYCFEHVQYLLKPDFTY